MLFCLYKIVAKSVVIYRYDPSDFVINIFGSVSSALINAPASSIIFDAPTGQNAGQAVTTSGGVSGTTGQAMETLSPFMSLNYIIYTGKV